MAKGEHNSWYKYLNFNIITDLQFTFKDLLT